MNSDTKVGSYSYNHYGIGIEPIIYTGVRVPVYITALMVVLLLIIISLTLGGVVWLLSTIIGKAKLCMNVSHYRATLGSGVLVTTNTAYSAAPNYLTETVYCSTNDLPKLTARVQSRYITILNTGSSTLSIPSSSIYVFTSETSITPVNPIKANVVKATMLYPDVTLATPRNSFVFNSMTPYDGTIPVGSVALIKTVSTQTVYLYSLTFQYTGTTKTSITLYVFNPASNLDYASGATTPFISFYQLNLKDLIPNTVVVIDFE